MSGWRVIIILIGLIFIWAAVDHWLIILGLKTEPLSGLPPVINKVLLGYFNSLAAIDLLIAFGMILAKRWSWWLAVVVAFTQIISHWTVIYYQRQLGIEPAGFRGLDITLSIILIIILSLKPVKKIFFDRGTIKR